MHNAGYRALGLDWHYVPFAIHDVERALAAMRCLGIRGFGISMPFKLEIMPWLDAIDPLAARIGAVNTVVNEGGVLTGFNTDWVGATRALAEQVGLDGLRVLLLGAGGAGRAIAFGLQHEGAEVCICNRHDDKARTLAKELGVSWAPWDARDATPFDALVNATSAGMTDVHVGSPFPVHGIRPNALVMDVVYKPLETLLLRDAVERGATPIHGGRMLLHQAAKQFELYTEHPAPLDVMDAALHTCMRGEQPTP